jgi:DNA-binding SARP family transcriptional activator
LDPRSPRRVRVELLGGFRVSFNRVPVELAVGAQRLVALVAVARRPVRRHKAAGLLWGDAEERRAAGNLRSSLWRLNRVVPGLLRVGSSEIALDSGTVVDLVEAAGQARRLVDPATPCREADLDPIPLCNDLLPGWYEDWVVIENERFREVRLHALEALAARLTQMCRFAEAVDAAFAAIAAEPLRESAWRSLIRAHVEEGNTSEALRQAENYRRLIRSELAIVPSPLLESLVRSLQKPSVS